MKSKEKLKYTGIAVAGLIGLMAGTYSERSENIDICNSIPTELRGRKSALTKELTEAGNDFARAIDVYRGIREPSTEEEKQSYRGKRTIFELSDELENTNETIKKTMGKLPEEGPTTCNSYALIGSLMCLVSGLGKFFVNR